MVQSLATNKRVIRVGTLVLFNVSIMASLRNLPLVAEYGLSSLIFFFIVGLVFLIPCALVSAELATGWSKSGGVYIWVREAFGDRWGFFAIWMQWIHSVTWYPAILAFVSISLAYVVNPELSKNKYYVISTVLFLFWTMTLVNYLGIKTSTWFSSIGVVLGTLVPGIFIISLGVIWIVSGRRLEVEMGYGALIPDLSSIHNLVFLAGLFLAFAGLEVSAAYASEVKNPQKNYPKAIIFAAIIVFFVFLLGSMSIAVVIPQKDISLVSGLMEAFETFLKHYHLSYLLPIMAILLVFGSLAEVNSWIMGPIKALYTTTTHGNLPPFFQRLNRHGMPTRLLLFQGIIVSVAAVSFLITPDLSASYWLLSAMSAQMYLLMYMLMFLAAIRLRYTKPHVPRAYRIPHPHKGIWIVSLVGFLACTFGFFIGFVPPNQIEVGSLYFYESFMIIGLFVIISIPLLIHQFRDPSWVISPSEN